MRSLDNVSFGDLRPYVLYLGPSDENKTAFTRYVPQLGDYGLYQPTSCAWMVPTLEVPNDDSN